MGLGLSTFQLHYIMIVSDPMISKLIGDGVIKEQIRSSSVARISALNTLLHCNSTRMEKLIVSISKIKLLGSIPKTNLPNMPIIDFLL